MNYLIIGVILLTIAVSAGTLYKHKNNKVKSVSIQSFGLGTILQLTSYGKNSDAALEEAVSRIGEIDDEMSFFKEDSDISKINKNSGSKQNFVKVSDDTYYVIKRAVEYGELSDGAIDLTVRPILDLWGFGKEKHKAPEVDDIRNLTKLVSYKDILFNAKENSIGLKNKFQSIDVNCIAKGYAADEAKKVLVKHKIKNAIINLGGNVYAHGSNVDGSPWVIGIQHPMKDRGNYVGHISVKDKSVVTSGDYEKFLIYNNEKYHHIINPKTGYPVKNKIISTTIISDYSIDGDALTTCLYVMGVENGLKFIEKMNNIDAIIITEDKLIYATENIKDAFVISDNEFAWG